MFDENRRWNLTDVGAVQWFQIIATLNQQQITINALIAEVNRLALNAPTMANKVSPYTTSRQA